jgi:molybdopterin molybdotransferase
MSGERSEPLVRCGSPEEAVAALAGRVARVLTETVALEDAAGRVLAEAVRADRPSPACDVSAMDGFAVRLEELGGGELPVIAEARIGVRPPAFSGSGAVRIVTGAPVPAGADAVIKREDVEELGDRIRISPEAAMRAQPGLNIRRRGDNAAPGAEVVPAGVLVAPPVAAALASFGATRVRVSKRVRVGVLSTGDEVLGAGETPTEWQLRDGNSPAIWAMLSTRRWIEVLPARRARDDPGEIGAAAGELLNLCDALVLSGGVSMGDRDFVPGVLRGLGATIVFHKVPQRPGKPVLGAVMPDGRPVFGLPGNPLSVMVTCRRIVLPALERASGLARGSAPPLVRVVNAGERALELWWHRQARMVGPGEAEVLSTASSGDIAGGATSDGFVEVPPGAIGTGPWAFYAW